MSAGSVLELTLCVFFNLSVRVRVCSTVLTQSRHHAAGQRERDDTCRALMSDRLMLVYKLISVSAH